MNPTNRLEHYVTAYSLNACKRVLLPIDTCYELIEAIKHPVAKSIILVDGNTYLVETMELY